MKITMLENVAPQEYGLKGQYGWAGAVQWRKGASYYMDELLALQMIDNSDAVESEPIDVVSETLSRAADRAEAKQTAGVL